jgi:hypothetical protein
MQDSNFPLGPLKKTKWHKLLILVGVIGAISIVLGTMGIISFKACALLETLVFVVALFILKRIGQSDRYLLKHSPFSRDPFAGSHDMKNPRYYSNPKNPASPYSRQKRQRHR